ncbi:shikimate kinase [Pelagibacterales bacterium SAG-MED17]|nr:shikimate kinase [Pelagibacterales bacterium SAG-MED17]
MKSDKNIVLIGMMGSGKSSIGKILSKKLKLTFVDIDQKIEEFEGLQILEIFKKKGENYFRKIEEKISLKFLSSENSVISLGGGGFINVSIRKMCEKNCLSIWLDWKNETIINRIYKSKKRPLAMKLTKGQINDLIKERSKFYSLADQRINCDKLDKVEIINKILDIHENK